MYGNGLSVPQNYLCALKWQLRSVEGSDEGKIFSNIGSLFEYGNGVPLDKYKALEWYCHSGNKAYIDSLKGQCYHRSATDKSMLNSTIDLLY
jgi:TPR repeat protein